MAKKWYAHINYDFDMVIRMGPLTVTGMQSGQEREIAPSHVQLLPQKAGTQFVFRTKASMKEFCDSVNADHPGAATPIF